MNRQDRIYLLAQLGEYLRSNEDELRQAKQAAYLQNSWFIPEFIDLAIKNIADNFLQKELLEKWIDSYEVPEETLQPKTVGIVMAGNIPLVGFHDFLCVFASGHTAMMKPSSKDDVLIKHIVKKMYDWKTDLQNTFSFAEQLKRCDAYIATGSNNSGRYFEYYFSKYPNIIRRNRTSVAILDGTETSEELDRLADDIQLYFGLGCRNVTKLYVPENYDFIPLLNALKKYHYFIEFHKYRHNYDYQLALLIMNNKQYMNNGSIIFTQNTSLFSPVSELNYEYYTDRNILVESLEGNDDVQCIVGHDDIPFGKTQSPSLTDYADGANTMEFLLKV